MTVLFYEKQGKVVFFLNLISVLKLALFRGRTKRKRSDLGPVSSVS